MGDLLGGLMVIMTPALVTIVIARALVQEKHGRPPLLKNIFWTFGIACLVWGIISVMVLRRQLNCVNPPDVEEDGCGMALFCFTGPVLLNTALVLVGTAGYVIWQLVSRRKDRNRIDWREGKLRDFDLSDLIDK